MQVHGRGDGHRGLQSTNGALDFSYSSDGAIYFIVKGFDLNGLTMSRPNFMNFSATRASRRIPQFLAFSANKYSTGRIAWGMLGGWFTKRGGEK